MVTPPTSSLALLSQLTKCVYRELTAAGFRVEMKPFITLSLLRELGPVPQQCLGDALCLDPNNTVLTLNELEDDGLVVRRRDPDDRRRHIVEVTPAGEAWLEDTQSKMGPAEDDILAPLSNEERRQLHDLLHKALHSERGVITRTRQAADAG